MFRSVLTALALVAATATPALAFDIEAMSDNERSIFSAPKSAITYWRIPKC